MADDRLSNTELQKWYQQSQNPAAPAGAQQLSGAIYESAQPGDTRFADSPLTQWFYRNQDATGLADNPQGWYTGANSQGVDNGWFTDLAERATTQYNAAVEAGTAADYFDPSNKPTGVAVFDHTTSSGAKVTFGDIYDNGEFKGNFYDMYDKPTADLMMLSWAGSDGETLRHVYGERNPEDIAAEVDRVRQRNNDEWAAGETNRDFNNTANQVEDRFAESDAVQGGLMAAGALGSGLIAAGALTAASGVGAPIGAGMIAFGTGLSALAGGVAAWMNRDTLTETAARNFVITSMSKEKFGTDAAIATGLYQWSGLAGKMITPLSNLTQGSADWIKGEIGDKESEFYRTNAEGKRVVGKGWIAADMVATVGDSLLQFSNPIGAMAYMAQMSGTIVGETAELALTGGQTFSFYRGDFDNIFTDDEGNFDASAALAGIGKVGIDVVQLGLARGLTQGVNTGRAAVGKEAVYKFSQQAKTGTLGIRPASLGGLTTAERSALEAGGKWETAAGRKLVVDDAGNVVSSRARYTTQMLAPSEFLRSVSTRIEAQRLAAARGGAYTMDDFYRAATSLSIGKKAWNDALVNALGEGTEEGVQQIFEAHSHGDPWTWEEVGSAFAYGAASGLGMALGTTTQAVKRDDQMFELAKLGHFMQTGGEKLTRDQWKSYSEVERTAKAQLSFLQQKVAMAAYQKNDEENALLLTENVVAVQKVADALRAADAIKLANGTERVNKSMIMVPHEDHARLDANDQLEVGSVPADAAVMSGNTVLESFDRLLDDALKTLGMDSINEDLAKVKKELEDKPNDQDLLDLQTKRLAEKARVERIIAAGDRLLTTLRPQFEALYKNPTTGAPPSFDDIEATAEVINLVLRDLYHERLDIYPDNQGAILSSEEKRDLSRFVGLTMARYPIDNPGSLQVLLPQVSAALTAYNGDNVVQVHQSVMDAIGGDYDGDLIAQMMVLLFDDDAFVNGRMGMNLQGQGLSINIPTPKQEEYNVALLSRALNDLDSDGARNYAANTLTEIETSLRNRYQNYVDTQVLDTALAQFVEQVYAGNTKARSFLINTLFGPKGAPTELTNYSRGVSNENEAFWIDTLVKAKLNKFQETYALQRPLLGVPNTDDVAPITRAPKGSVRTRTSRKGATPGTTMGLLLEGDSLFRMVQDLNYTVQRVATLSKDDAEYRAALQDMALFYRALSSGITRSELDEVRSKDEITARVWVTLKNLALEATRVDKSLGYAQSVMLISNLKVQDIDYTDEDAPVATGKEITLAQMLLKMSLMQDRREKNVIWESDQQLQAKHATLDRMTRPPSDKNPVPAQEAFFQIIGMEQLFALLGEDAYVFGEHLTVDQWVRAYAASSVTRRAAMAAKLRDHESWNKDRKQGLPFDVDDILSGEVTPFRVLAETMLAVGSHVISMDTTFANKPVAKKWRHLHGERARRSYSTSDSFTSGFQSVREAMKFETDVNKVAEFFNQQRELFRAILSLLNDDRLLAVVKVVDNKLYAPAWLYQVFTMKDPEEAEMVVYRQLLLADIQHKNNLRAQDNIGRLFSDDDRQIMRVVRRLSLMKDGGLTLKMFLDKLYTSKSTEEWTRWVNTTPNILGEQAPLTAWSDSVADLDPDKADGGWGTKLSGAEFREAVRYFERTAALLAKDINEEEVAANKDVTIVAALERAIAVTYDGADPAAVGLQQEDLDVLQGTEQMISNVSQYQTALSPEDMLRQGYGAATTFYGNASAKAQNPDHVEAAGDFEVWREAVGFNNPLAQAEAAMNTVSIDDLAQNPGMLLRSDGMRVMDHEGRIMELDKPDARLFALLMKNKETRSLGRLIFWPHVMERDDYTGALRPKLLIGKSVKDFVASAQLTQLFPRGNRLTMDAAARYNAYVEGVALQMGGWLDVQQFVNDYVIARTGSADRALSSEEIEDAVNQAHHVVATILQAASTLSPEKLDEFIDELKMQMRRNTVAERMGLLTPEQRKDGTGLGKAFDTKVSDEMIELAVSARVEDDTETLKKLASEVAITTDMKRLKQLKSQMQAIKTDLANFKKRVELLRDTGMVDRLVTMYRLPGDNSDPAYNETKQDITDFINNNIQMMQTMVSASVELSDFFERRIVSTDPRLPEQFNDAQWETLGNAVIAYQISQYTAAAAGSVGVPLFPSGKLADYANYYDVSFGYLLDRFKSTTKLMQAAYEVNRQSGGLNQVPIGREDFARLFDKMFFKDFRFGGWTDDIARNSISARERLLSASSEPAVKLYGSTPATEATESAWGERTYLVPDDGLLSKVSLGWDEIVRADLSEFPDYTEVDVLLPNTTAPVRRPLAQINHRYAKTVTVTWSRFGQSYTVDLLATNANVGRPFTGSSKAAGSGLQEIQLIRIQAAMDQLGIRASDKPQIDIEFFHPDSQPAEPEWQNNLYFEGTQFLLDADQYPSLHAGLYFAPGAVSQSGQKDALSSTKHGTRGFKVPKKLANRLRKNVEGDWSTDFAGMLRKKTRAIMDLDHGFGHIPASSYNAVYKDMKTRNWVLILDPVTGAKTLMNADQVIAAQQAGTFDSTNAQLWVPDNRTLRSLMGEIGEQGLDRLYTSVDSPNLEQIATNSGTFKDFAKNFPHAGESTALDQTHLVSRSRQNELVVRMQLDRATKSRFEQNIAYRHRLLAEGLVERAQLNMDVAGARRRGRKFSKDGIRAEDINLSLTDLIPFMMPRVKENTELGLFLTQELSNALEASQMWWIYREGSVANPPAGELSEAALSSGGPKGMPVLPMDVVSVDLERFNGDLALAKKRIDFFMGRGATVELVPGAANGEMLAQLGIHLEDNDYYGVAGSKHVFKPLETSSNYQNIAARESTLTEMRPVNTKTKALILNVLDLPIEEGGAWAVPNNPRLAEIAIVVNVLPTNYLGTFNIPASRRQIDYVREHILGLDTPEGRALLTEQANGQITDPAKRQAADAAVLDSFDALLLRYADYPDDVLPPSDTDFGTGDFLPLVDIENNVLLYRVGYKAPTRAEVEAMVAQPPAQGAPPAKIAVFKSSPDANATSHRGKVVQWRTRANYGLSVELTVPLQQFGDKQQVEWGGMKYTLVPRPKSVELPSHGIFNQWGIDLVASMHDQISKQSTIGTVNNFRNAFALFGIDFTADVAKTFGVDNQTAVDVLTRIQRETTKLTRTQALELYESLNFADDYMARLTDTLGQQKWMQSLINPSTASEQITRAIIIYLMTPGARVKDVLRSGGFNDFTSLQSAESIEMPQLFTNYFDRQKLGSPLRSELFKRLNQQIHNPRWKQEGIGYYLAETWHLEVINKDKSKNLRGFLQYAELHTSGDNPVKNAMSFEGGDRADVSASTARISYLTTGARTLMNTRRGKKTGDPAQPFDKLWGALTNVDRTSTPKHQMFITQTGGEALRRARALDAVKAMRRAIVRTDELGWDEDKNQIELTEFNNKVSELLSKLGMRDSQAEIVEYWIRGFFGQLYGVDPETNEQLDKITLKSAIYAVEEMLWAVDNGFLPWIGGEIPAGHVHDLQMLYRLNVDGPGPFELRTGMQPNAAPATTWNDWVLTALGGIQTSENLFDPLYLLVTDGLFHTYQNATETLLDLPVSLNPEISKILMDPATGRWLASLDPNTQRLAAEPILMDNSRLTLDQLIGGGRVHGAGNYLAPLAPADAIAKRRKMVRKWRIENDMAIPLEQSLWDFRRNGFQVADNSTRANTLMRMLLDLRAGLALLNPALYFSMGPEQWVRGTWDTAANIITGDSTKGLSGKAMAKLKLSRHSPEFIDRLQLLYNNGGKRTGFKKMIYKEVNFQRPHVIGMALGRGERATRALARWGQLVQDPTWGTRTNTLYRRYVDAALQSLMANPLGYGMTPDQLVSAMMTNDLFLEQNHPVLHKQAVNAVADIRSLKDTPISLALRGIYEPLSNSSHNGVNFFGNLVFKLPLMFAGYASNVIVHVTGMQGPSDLLAAFIQGRDKPNTFLHRVAARARGKEFTPEENAQFDMSSVLEGIDLTRSFVRSGVTLTSLFTLGLLSGSSLFNLSGEDDETRKRRRMAQLQRVPFMGDPRQVSEDFRNADAIYMDWLPAPLEVLFGSSNKEARAMVHLNWTLRQFISPIIGMEKFFDTGDARHIMWGFQDAIGAFPLINTLMWDDTVRTAQMLQEQAAEVDDDSTQGMSEAAYYLAKVVGTYEKMLFESAFANQMLQVFDGVDRDPYLLPQPDGQGGYKKDIEGDVMAQEQTLEPFIVDPKTGEIANRYLKRSPVSALAHSFAENRATFSAFMWLLPGHNDYSRWNMPAKTREFARNPLNQEEAEATIRWISESMGGLPKFSETELDSKLRDEAYRNKDYARLDTLVEEVRATINDYGDEPLSVLDSKGREVITQAGARGVFRGLVKNTLQLGDPSLQNLYIPWEMRLQIQKEWTAEIYQEGLDLGLTPQKAESRLKRLWGGEYGDSTSYGIGDILWAKPEDGGIPTTPAASYKQLNTTYVMGPDGLPWATGQSRQSFLAALGISPIVPQVASAPGSQPTDARFNTIDPVAGVNTGLRALKPTNETWDVPTNIDLAEEMKKALQEAVSQGGGGGGYNYGSNNNKSGGYYYGGGYRRRGGGSSYSPRGYGSGSYFSRMYALPGGVAPYGNSVPNTYSSNPIIRRATVRRERVWSERGRLKQWQ